MPDTSCAHCRTPIVDPAISVDSGGQAYCCPNCLELASGRVSPATPGRLICGHCGLPIVDASTQVDKRGQCFCCVNCQTAFERRLVIPRQASGEPLSGG